MNRLGMKIIGNLSYFFGLLMIVVPILAFLATAGMAILAGPVFLVLPVAGIVLVLIGKRMIIETNRLHEEDRANEELKHADDNNRPKTPPSHKGY